MKTKHRNAFAVAIALILAASTAKAARVTSLAEINNNPGNLRANGIKWEGAQGQNRGFVKFSSPEMGIRAAFKVLKKNDGKTLSALISKWAPASDRNPTAKYISNAEKWTGIKSKEKIDTDEEREKVLRAIIKMETGAEPYSDLQIKNGIALALGGKMSTAKLPDLKPYGAKYL